MVISNWGYSHQLHAVHFKPRKSDDLYPDTEPQLADSMQFARVDLKWLGANRNVEIEKTNASARTFNYYNIPDHPNGVTGVKEFESVCIGNIYPGIDVRFYDAGGLFEHDYELAEGSDYRDIRIEISGTYAHLNNKGELVLQTALGTITESSPVVFQDGKELHSEWVQLENNIWGFEIPDANPELAMVIDPISRMWGTYYGGNNNDQISCTEVDTEDNVYVGGISSSAMNIATVGTEQTTIASSSDVFLARFDGNGNQIWGTYVGGNGNEISTALDFDQSGNIFITGYTESTNNISTPGSHQEVKGDAGNLFDGFLIKFNPDGTRQWGTYYGGSGDDRVRNMHVDSGDQIYIVGLTNSPDQIVTPGAHQEDLDGTDEIGDDGFIVKFTPAGARLWGSYYGGNLEDQIFAVNTDQNLNIYVAGHSASYTDISTPGSFQPNHGGGEWDLIYVKFNPEGVRQWATYIGGNGDDYTWNSCFSTDGSIYIVGRTASTGAIATGGSHQDFLAGNFDAFLMKLSLEGNQLWGTYFGGNNFERAFGCECLDDGSVLISGRTESDNLISTPGVHQEDYGGGIDAFLSKFNSDGSLNWSTYYGGNSNDMGYGCAIDSEESVYLAGWSESNTNISTAGIHQEDYAGSRDGFIVKFAECNTSYNQLEIMTCEDYTAPDGEVYDETGEYTTTLQDQLGCDSIITINLTISDQIINDQYHFICEGESITLPDGTTTSEEGITTNEYISFQGCDSLVNHHVSLAPDFEHYIDTTICENAVLNDPNGNPIDQAGEYTFLYNTIHGCDSIVHLELDFIPTYNTTHSTTICQGDYFLAPNGHQVYYPGTYEYTLQSSNGCDSVVTYEVNVNASPIAQFSTDPSGGSDVFETSIQFYNESVGEDYIFWDFFEYGSSDQLNPIIEFTDSAGIHPVCLYAFTEEGCADSVCVNYSITEELAIYIPNAFTPNGDGINDLFFVVGEGIDPDDFLMRVFNRWGEIVFESYDLQKKWDGSEPARTHYAQNEVYTYQVIVGALYHTEKKEITGRVTAIR